MKVGRGHPSEARERVQLLFDEGCEMLLRQQASCLAPEADIIA